MAIIGYTKSLNFETPSLSYSSWCSLRFPSMSLIIVRNWLTVCAARICRGDNYNNFFKLRQRISVYLTKGNDPTHIYFRELTFVSTNRIKNATHICSLIKLHSFDVTKQLGRKLTVLIFQVRFSFSFFNLLARFYRQKRWILINSENQRILF